MTYSSICFTLFLVDFASLVLTAFFANQATYHRKLGIRYFPRSLESPFMVLFRPHQLTPLGLWDRRLCFFFLTAYGGIQVLLGTLGMILGNP